MSKTILADVSGFTPIIDSMAMEHGLIYAAVFGRMWRFCQMEDGICKASLEKIAHGLHVDKATVMRYADRLVVDGYLKDLTPNLRNAPHVYADTGKAAIRVGIGATVAGCNATVADDNETVAGCNATVAESKLKIDSKIDPKKDDQEGISHPDFERARVHLKESHPTDLESAAPVLLEYDARPFRLLIKVASMPPDFIDNFNQALRMVNPRRSYQVTFVTPGTGRPAPVIVKAETPDRPPILIDKETLSHWQLLKEEMHQDVNPITWRDLIEPSQLVSVNGKWTVAVPDVSWAKANILQGLTRSYKRDTGNRMEFVFVELK